MPAKISKAEWVRRISEKGSGRYEFVKWEVDGEFGYSRKCVVRCIIGHEEWVANVGNLVDSGSGCPKCGLILSANKRRKSEMDVICKINKSLNIKFVRWASEYRNGRSKAICRCDIDGFEWPALIDDLIVKGSGCPQCSGNRRWTSGEREMQINSLPNIQFVRWSGEYRNQLSRAICRCKVDGFEWSTTVNNLLSHGSRCPQCAECGYNPGKKGYLYSLLSECGNYIKVGISNKPSKRLRKLEKSTPFKFSLIEQISGDGAKIAKIEKYFHSKYERAGFTGFDGCTEWLLCGEELMKEIMATKVS